MPNKFYTRALYLQVRDAVIEKIRAHKLPAGSQLPNETQLASEFGVSQGTVRKSLELLERENLISRRQGRGTFVAELDPDRIAYRFYPIRGLPGLPTTKTRGVEVGAASEHECDRLALPVRENVVRVRRTREMSEVPFIIETAVFPEKLVPYLATEKSVPDVLLFYLFETTGIVAKTCNERVTAIAADEEASSLLGVAVGAPLLRMERVLFDTNDTPIELRIRSCNLGSGYYFSSTSTAHD